MPVTIVVTTTRAVRWPESEWLLRFLSFLMSFLSRIGSLSFSIALSLTLSPSRSKLFFFYILEIHIVFPIHLRTGTIMIRALLKGLFYCYIFKKSYFLLFNFWKYILLRGSTTFIIFIFLSLDLSYNSVYSLCNFCIGIGSVPFY